MAASTKKKIGLTIILVAILCFVSLPRLTLTTSAQSTIVKNPDFGVYAFPPCLSIAAGGSMNTTILVISFSGFTGTVSLAASAPNGWATSFAPSSLSLANGYCGYCFYGPFNWSRLSIAVPSGAALGRYTIVVKGTSGALVHTVNVTVDVVAPDFWMFAYPSYLPVSAGSTGNSTILVSSLYGFSGTVSLATTAPAGWKATFAKSSLSIVGCYFNWSRLSIAVPSGAALGRYTIVVKGTSGALVHTVNVTVDVVAPDFWMFAYPSYLPVSAGSTGNSTIFVMSLYGFNGTVSLATTAPAGWTTSVVPSSLSMTGRYWNCSMLSVAVPLGTAAGKYTIVVTGKSGSLTHSANVTVVVK